MEISQIMMDVRILAQSNQVSNAQGPVLQVPTPALKYVAMGKTMVSMDVTMEISSMETGAHQHVLLKVDSGARVGIRLCQINALKCVVMGSITAKISVMMAIM
jgi:hypothetical protein